MSHPPQQGTHGGDGPPWRDGQGGPAGGRPHGAPQPPPRDGQSDPYKGQDFFRPHVQPQGGPSAGTWRARQRPPQPPQQHSSPQQHHPQQHGQQPQQYPRQPSPPPQPGQPCPQQQPGPAPHQQWQGTPQQSQQPKPPPPPPPPDSPRGAGAAGARPRVLSSDEGQPHGSDAFQRAAPAGESGFFQQSGYSRPGGEQPSDRPGQQRTDRLHNRQRSPGTHGRPSPRRGALSRGEITGQQIGIAAGAAALVAVLAVLAFLWPGFLLAPGPEDKAEEIVAALSGRDKAAFSGLVCDSQRAEAQQTIDGMEQVSGARLAGTVQQPSSSEATVPLHISLNGTERAVMTTLTRQDDGGWCITKFRRQG